MKNAIILLTLLSISFICLAGDKPNPDKPRSPAAVAALNKHEAAIARAQADYHRAIAAAERQLVADLDDAMKVAMKSQNVEEIKRIDAAKSEAVAASKASAAIPNIGPGQLTPEDVAGKTFITSAFSGPIRNRRTLDRNGSGWRVEGGKLLLQEGDVTLTMQPCSDGKVQWFCEIQSFEGDGGQLHALYPVSTK